MNFLLVLVLFSSLSFIAYGVSYFFSPHMKSEFKRFNLEKYGLLTIAFELAGAIGLLIGLLVKPILLISSAGLTILMLLGLIARLKVKDNLWVCLPALIFLLLNAYIFYVAVGS